MSERLHDDLCQILVAANFKLNSLRSQGLGDALSAELASVENMIGYARKTAHAVALQLSPPVLHAVGLLPALVHLGAEMERLYGLTVEIADDGMRKPLDGFARTALYLGVRELLLNVARHADAEAAQVRCLRSGDWMRIEVSDDGCGIDAAADAAPAAIGKPGGLQWLRTRIGLIGGELHLDADAGRGLCAAMTAPLGDPDRPDVR